MQIYIYPGKHNLYMGWRGQQQKRSIQISGLIGKKFKATPKISSNYKCVQRI